MSIFLNDDDDDDDDGRGGGRDSLHRLSQS